MEWTLGNLSRHENGRHASRIARELVKSPAVLCSGGSLGSIGLLQQLVAISIDVCGSQRVDSAQRTSFILDGSISSSISTMKRPRYAPSLAPSAMWAACRAWPP